MILTAFVIIGNPIRQAIVSVWIIVFLATINHGTYLPFSRRDLHFLRPDRQSCSRAQPNHPEIGSVTELFGSAAFSMCIWSLLPPTCPNLCSREGTIPSPVHH